MNTAESKITALDPEIMADLEAAARYAITGECDPQTLCRIEERAASARKALGEQNSSADIIRQMRDSR